MLTRKLETPSHSLYISLSSIFLPFFHSSLFLTISIFFLVSLTLTPSLPLPFTLYSFPLSLFLPLSSLPLPLTFFPPSISPLFFSFYCKHSLSILSCVITSYFSIFLFLSLSILFSLLLPLSLPSYMYMYLFLSLPLHAFLLHI